MEQWRMVIVWRNKKVVDSNIVIKVVVRFVVNNIMVNWVWYKFMMRFQVSYFMVNMMDRF